MKTEGMGRARLGRFAAITVPATLASVGLGIAIVQGMVAATISSAGGFDLDTSLSADALKVRPGQTQVGDADTGKETIFAETENARADGLTVKSPTVNLPLVQGVHLEIASTDSNIGLGNVALNAATLRTPNGASLNNVTLGQAQSRSGFSDTSQASGYDATGFSLVSGESTLNNISAKAYAVTLGGLSLNNLSLSVKRS